MARPDLVVIEGADGDREFFQGESAQARAAALARRSERERRRAEHATLVAQITDAARQALAVNVAIRQGAAEWLATQPPPAVPAQQIVFMYAHLRDLTTAVARLTEHIDGITRLMAATVVPALADLLDED